MDYDLFIEELFRSSITHMETALSTCRLPLDGAIHKTINALENGGIIYFAGNGGSAADASHIAAEFIGSFEHFTAPLPAIALTTDTSVLTSISNDFSYDRVFLQQAQGLLRANDLLWLISTSGESMNLFHAAAWAREKKIATVGLLGKRGGRLAQQVDYPIIVPGENAQRIQEVHILMLHILASAVRQKFPNGVPWQQNPGKSPEESSD